MEILESHKELVENILTEYTRVPFSNAVVDIQTVFDRNHDHYLIMLVGREGKRRIHGCLIHIDIVDGKFWIRRDGTEEGVVMDLIRAGIPKKDIMLAFYLEHYSAEEMDD